MILMLRLNLDFDWKLEPAQKFSLETFETLKTKHF